MLDVISYGKNSDLETDLHNIEKKVEDIETFKFPNATIIGNPVINNGQVSGFSDSDYLQFPYIVDFNGRPFVIDTNFTTSDDLTAQQNIFDSDFGFAFAIRNNHFVIAVSTNGTSWNLGEAVGTYTILPNTTYKVKLSWDGNIYKVAYSIDNGQTYIDDIALNASASPYPKQIYIGIGENFGSVLNFFKGSINLNYCELIISNTLDWQGMDDVGIASRLARDLSNISEMGKQRIKEIVAEVLNN